MPRRRRASKHALRLVTTWAVIFCALLVAWGFIVGLVAHDIALLARFHNG